MKVLLWITKGRNDYNDSDEEDKSWTWTLFFIFFSLFRFIYFVILCHSWNKRIFITKLTKLVERWHYFNIQFYWLCNVEKRVKDKTSGPILHRIHVPGSVFHYIFLTHKNEIKRKRKKREKWVNLISISHEYYGKVLFSYFRQLLKNCYGQTKCNLLQCINYLLKSNERQNKIGIMSDAIAKQITDSTE